jgi:hypothetical protein
MLFGQIISAYCKNLIKHVPVPCIEYVGLRYVKVGSICNNYYAFKQ